MSKDQNNIHNLCSIHIYSWLNVRQQSIINITNKLFHYYQLNNDFFPVVMYYKLNNNMYYSFLIHIIRNF